MSGRNRSPRDAVGIRVRTVFLLFAGTAVGFFLLLFIAANDAWVVVHLPNPPWHPDPSRPAFEARLWAIMVAAFLFGLGVAGAFLYPLRRIGGRRTHHQTSRIAELEEELEKTNRLLAATRKTL